jgi:cell fate (sporulation/competence/biofilm development) regulator YlbF (YheA/YmcA/DUF963 family)
MTAIIEMARRLGKAIADSPQAAALKAARDEMDKDAEAPRLLNDYQAQADKMLALERDNKPVEVEDKRKLRDLQEKLAGSPAFKKYTAAQVDYVDLMRKVNNAIRGELGEAEGEPSE